MNAGEHETQQTGEEDTLVVSLPLPCQPSEADLTKAAETLWPGALILALGTTVAAGGFGIGGKMRARGSDGRWTLDVFAPLDAADGTQIESKLAVWADGLTGQTTI